MALIIAEKTVLFMGRYPANKASSPRLKIGKIQVYREDVLTKHRLRGRVESFIKNTDRD